MTVIERIEMLKKSQAEMESSKLLVINDAERLLERGREEDALRRLERAAQYAWGFWRPDGWKTEKQGEPEAAMSTKQMKEKAKKLEAEITDLHEQLWEGATFDCRIVSVMEDELAELNDQIYGY